MERFRYSLIAWSITLTMENTTFKQVDDLSRLSWKFCSKLSNWRRRSSWLLLRDVFPRVAEGNQYAKAQRGGSSARWLMIPHFRPEEIFQIACVTSWSTVWITSHRTRYESQNWPVHATHRHATTSRQICHLVIFLNYNYCFCGWWLRLSLTIGRNLSACSYVVWRSTARGTLHPIKSPHKKTFCHCE